LKSFVCQARKLAPMASDEKKFPSKIPLFSRQRGKSYIQPYPSYTKIKHLRRYAGQNEVRFKVTDKKMEGHRQTASYLYEYNLMEKPNIHSFGRWCMDYVCREYGVSVIESKIMKQREQRQKQMQQPSPLSYPGNYTADPRQPF
jgi:hypothetical protein